METSFSFDSCPSETPKLAIFAKLTKFSIGLEGIDLDLCGPPGFRTSPDLNLAIGFKTMLHTPDADQLFLTRLKQVGMSGLNDSIVLVELGSTWGTRGRRQPSTRGSPHLPDLREDEEVRYFVHWVHTVAFPNRLVLWMPACGCEQRLKHRGLSPLMRAMWYEVQKEYKEAAVMVDKCVLSTAEFGFPAGHGCRGPLLNVLGQILHATVQQVQEKRTGSSKVCSTGSLFSFDCKARNPKLER